MARHCKAFVVSLALLASPLTLNACAGPVQTKVDVRQPLAAPLAAGASYAFIPLPEDAPPPTLDAAIRSAIAARLPGLKPAPFDEADLLVSYGLSDRAAATAIADLSPAKRKKFLGPCVKRVVRLSVTIISRAEGKPLYSGSAEEGHCKASSESVLPELASALLPEGA